MSQETFVVGKLEAVNPRVYRYRLPQKVTLPALTYQRISTVRTYNHDGDDGLPTVRWQVDCWARDPDVVDTLAEGVTATFTGYADATRPAVFIGNDLEFDDVDSGLFRRIVDVLVTYREV